MRPSVRANVCVRFVCSFHPSTVFFYVACRITDCSGRDELFKNGRRLFCLSVFVYDMCVSSTVCFHPSTFLCCGVSTYRSFGRDCRFRKWKEAFRRACVRLLFAACVCLCACVCFVQELHPITRPFFLLLLLELPGTECCSGKDELSKHGRRRSCHFVCICVTFLFVAFQNADCSGRDGRVLRRQA